jgi:heme/copper-type cytochrome/quinol oxidase subunit 2
VSPKAVLRRCAPVVTAVTLALTTAACAGTAPSPAGASASSGASAPPAGSTVHQIAIRYADGRVSGDTGRVSVRSGEQVRLTVTSDVDDEVHVHGYDLMQDVTPDGPATITFQASVPGVFEVELEHRGKQLFTFQVS